MVSRVSAWLKPQGRLAITTFAPNGNDTGTGKVFLYG